MSNNKIAIYVGVDSQHQVFARVRRKARLSSQLIVNIYGRHIKLESHIIYDGLRGHDELIKNLKL